MLLIKILVIILKQLLLISGTDDGVEENMTVIADQGLVGYVVSVTDTTAKVQTIIDTASSVSCIMSSNDEV